MSLLIDLIKKGKGKPIDKVPDEIFESRMEICNECPLQMWTGNCKTCGCFVADKTRYADEECPNGKWGKHGQNN